MADDAGTALCLFPNQSLRERQSPRRQERAQALETLAKEWQEKYFSLHRDWQETKSQLVELYKIKKNHEHLLATFTNVRNFLGKTLGMSYLSAPDASHSYEEKKGEESFF